MYLASDTLDRRTEESNRRGRGETVPTSINLKRVQAILGYRFHEPVLLEYALSQGHYHDHNKKLEQTGDLVATAIVTRILIDTLPRVKDFGALRGAVQKLCETDPMAEAVERCGLHLHAYPNPANKYWKTDLFEALVGAVAADSDGDLTTLESCVRRIFGVGISPQKIHELVKPCSFYESSPVDYSADINRAKVLADQERLSVVDSLLERRTLGMAIDGLSNLPQEKLEELKSLYIAALCREAPFGKYSSATLEELGRQYFLATVSSMHWDLADGWNPGQSIQGIRETLSKLHRDPAQSIGRQLKLRDLSFKTKGGDKPFMESRLLYGVLGARIVWGDVAFLRQVALSIAVHYPKFMEHALTALARERQELSFPPLDEL